jgi:hypothetical protein
MEPSRILCLRFPNWPIQAHRLRFSRDSDAHACPAAIALHTPLPDSTGVQHVSADADVLRDLALLRQLFPAARSGPAIVAVSGPAWKQGVRPGLPLAEARSLAAPLQPPQAAKGKPAAPQKQTSRSAAAQSGKQPVNAPAEQVQFVSWNAAADREELRLLSDPVRRFAPIVGLDSLPLPDSLLLNITGCGPLFGGEEQLAQELLQMLRASQLAGRVGIADSIAAAWAVAHTDSPGSPPIVVVATGTSGKQLNPLPTAAARLAVSDLEILQHLGIVRIGQLLALPVEDLPARLSAECVVRVRQLRGDVYEPIDPLPEIRPVQAAWVGDEPAVGVRDLQWILTRLSEEIATQLEQRRLACGGLQCEFIGVDRQSLEMPAGLVRPERSPKLLADVLSLRLEYLVLHALRQQQAQQKKPQKPNQSVQSAQSRKSTYSSQPNPDVPPQSSTNEAREEAKGAMHHRAKVNVKGAMHRDGTAQAPGLAELASGRDVGGPFVGGVGGVELPSSAKSEEAAGEAPPLLDFAALAEHPIAAVRLTAVSVPVPLSRQRRLFAEAGEESQEVSEHLGILLSRLAGRLGPESVLVAAERDDVRPEHSIGLSSVASGGFEDVLDQLVGADSRRGGGVSGRSGGHGARRGRSDRSSSGNRSTSEAGHVASAPANEPSLRPPRPLRLLAEPLEVSLEWRAAESAVDRSAEGQGADAMLRMWGREWHLVEWTGPERIQTAWWTESACQRDYYQAVSDRGSRFWLFRDLTAGRWYLQGIYD